MRDYGVVERRKVVIEMRTDYTPHQGEGQLQENKGGLTEKDVERVIRKMLERGSRT